ncbi:MAG: LuxR C-terminal-related transcriptional regulator [Alphaproteobacteria bacterium]
MPELRLETRKWHGEIGRVIDRLGSPSWPSVFLEAVRRIVDVDYSVVFAYRDRERPVCLFDTFERDRRDIFVDSYQAGPYLLDPFFQACHERTAPGVYRLLDLAPEHFYQSEYFRSYYHRTRLKEEIGFVLAFDKETTAVISLMRGSDSMRFSRAEMKRLHTIEPMVRAAAKQHWRLHGLEEDGAGRDAKAEPAAARLDAAFQNFGASVLTPREREVARLVLLGHSSEAIAQRLNISAGTVKIHRKNIYAKLGISSQLELFSLFLASLAGPARAPLQAFGVGVDWPFTPPVKAAGTAAKGQDRPGGKGARPGRAPAAKATSGRKADPVGTPAQASGRVEKFPEAGRQYGRASSREPAMSAPRWSR